MNFSVYFFLGGDLEDVPEVFFFVTVQCCRLLLHLCLFLYYKSYFNETDMVETRCFVDSF